MKETVYLLVIFILTAFVSLSCQWNSDNDDDSSSRGHYRNYRCYDRGGKYNCLKAKRRGCCDDSWMHKYVYCRQTCGQCRAGYGYQPSMYRGGYRGQTQPARQCYDKLGTRKCSGLKVQGHCQYYMYKNHYCRKSCGACVHRYPSPVSGGWTKWSKWTVCRGLCGTGVQYRVRSCTNPSPKYGGKLCKGIAKQTRNCDTGRPCQVDGGWTIWSKWTICRGSCGVGVQDRGRSCTNPSPKYGGKLCDGTAQQTRSCDTGRPCPVDGGWTIWSEWTVCRGSCGVGVQDRGRSCTNPSPKYGGKLCDGTAQQTRSCDTGRPCPVDGGWTIWSEWTVCRGSCGVGVQDRGRSCTNPSPKYGGKFCDGTANQTRSCDTGRPCPVDGGWTNWSEWTLCRGSCGQGTQDRVRSCTNPRPLYGGKICVGFTKETRMCDTRRPCPVDGSWSKWTRWTGCKGPCGQGSQNRFRTCTNPRPLYGGKDCLGSSRQTQQCDTGRPCEVQGAWEPWQSWGACSKDCHQGTQIRKRACLYPPNSAGNNLRTPCSGPGTESRPCNTDVPCKIPGIWTEWSAWASCTQSCRGGTQSRRRLCEYETNKGPYEKLPCIGYGHEVRECNSDIACIVQRCRPIDCKSKCLHGFMKDQFGCKICRCLQP